MSLGVGSLSKIKISPSSSVRDGTLVALTQSIAPNLFSSQSAAGQMLFALGGKAGSIHFDLFSIHSSTIS
jgi:hypothetical protein